ncbi:MAG TPA: class A beta-lactamase [Allosphingosinicella sp.]|nr:class A beta-lactamase [Allosphingosinicella sp.]
MLSWLIATMLNLALPGALAQSAPPDPEPRFAAIERRTGGRLGVALVDADGRLLISHRADERFAMCSTFKLPLAAMLLSSRVPLRTPLPLSRADLLSNSPHSEQALAAGVPLRAGLAAQAIIERSDNSAANLLLRRLGGPEALTAWLRRAGDPTTRLDRYELALNENRPGDPRDTTSPAAIARTTADIIYGDLLARSLRARLRGWTTASGTGLRRIRAGLPSGWRAGDKTGSCGTAFNDVAWFEVPGGASFVLAVYLDRPTVSAAQAEAAIAEVARHVAARAS